jgi:hypothetical protein
MAVKIFAVFCGDIFKDDIISGTQGIKFLVVIGFN